MRLWSASADRLPAGKRPTGKCRSPECYGIQERAGFYFKAQRDCSFFKGSKITSPQEALRLIKTPLVLLATTGVLPRTRTIPRTTRGISSSLLAAAAIRTTTIRTIQMGFVAYGFWNKNT
ncbi:TPA: hypothetical protein I8672_003364 [Legionella pneumophila]|nr:hypothetical protein [Legionella pneumophila]HEN8242151.1 hypothetical protein [Legionella pneumophila]